MRNILFSVKIKVNDESSSSTTNETPVFYKLIDTLLLAENLEHAAEVLANRNQEETATTTNRISEAPKRSTRPSTAANATTQRLEPPSSAISERTHAAKEPHYQLGDAGVVPSEHEHIPTFLERTRRTASVRSAGSKLNQRQSVLMNSKGVQTDNSRELLADQLLNHIEHYTQEDLVNQF